MATALVVIYGILGTIALALGTVWLFVRTACFIRDWWHGWLA